MAIKAKKPTKEASFDEWVRQRVEEAEEFRRTYQDRMTHELAAAIREMRVKAGFSQVELASMIGTTQSALARIENADVRGIPRFSTIYRIATALNRQVRVVFTGSMREPGRLVLVEEQRPRRQAPERS